MIKVFSPVSFARSLRVPMVVLAAAVLSACASTPEPIIGAAVSQPRADLGQAGYSDVRAQTYLLRPSDLISVKVFREPDFSMDAVRIGVEGNISLPLLGSVPAAGLTSSQFERNLTERLARAGLKTPMV
ncbi:MAG: polysaccharide biosynthesis/export family protein, partial [Pseudomonadota bacterium]